MNSYKVYRTLDIGNYQVSADIAHSGYSGEDYYMVTVIDMDVIKEVESIDCTQANIDAVFEQTCDRYSACRFIEEYARFQKNCLNQDMERCPENRKIYERAINAIEKAVRATRRGIIPINECMDTISDPAPYVPLRDL